MSSPILFCKTCERPYTKELSYKRHVAYCLRAQNRPRVRQKSCRGCSSAKSKCDFHSPCGRCVGKGIVCFYERSAAPKQTSSSPVALEQSGANTSTPYDTVTEVFHSTLQRDAAPSGSMFLPFDRLADVLSCADFSANPILSTPEDIRNSFQQLNSPSDLELVMGSFVQNLTEVQAAGLANTQARNTAMRARRLTDRDKFYTALGIPKSITTQLNNTVLRTLKMGDPIAQHSAAMILQSFRSFPRMMLQRETFPGYIHPHWNEFSGGCLNLIHQEPLANCMRIAEIFTSKSHEDKSSMWSMIRAEETRFGESVDEVSPEHLMSAVQASSIYIIMRFLDPSIQESTHALQMLLYFQILCEKLRQHCNGEFYHHEHIRPNMTWESWIFAENCRRMAIVWFLMGRVVGLTTGIPCSTAEDCRSLALPASRAVWEARSYMAWENEYVNFYQKEPQEMKTYGDLIDAHERSDDPRYVELIDKWNASVDGIGYLMNLAIPII